MKRLLRRIHKRRFPYEPLITIELSRGNLLHNLHGFQKLAPGHSIAPVLKSNAYGHGLVEIAQILEKDDRSNFPFLIVDSYFEAIALRSCGLKLPILIIGYTAPETIIRSSLKNISFTITSLSALHELTGLQSKSWFSKRKINIHIKIDTGMHRQGLVSREIPLAIELIKNDTKINLDGLCSHLSDADNAITNASEAQILAWNEASKLFKIQFPNIRYFHLSNTDGHRFTPTIQANVTRLGIGLYGLIDGKSFQPNLDLKPVMEMKTVLSSIKQINAGDTIGYGNTFKATKEMTIATIPVGYFEGIDRRLSNKGFIQVGKERTICPIIGRVSMNITSIDVTNLIDPQNGTEVTVISRNPTDPNSILNLAKQCGVITYESAVKIPAHLKRIVVK